jgi:hypothetical protein
MTRLKKKSKPSEKGLLKELRKAIHEGGRERLQRIQDRSRGLGAGYAPLSGPDAEDLLVLSLLGQDLANRALTRLTRVLIFLTVVLVVAGMDIALRIFN